MSIQIGRNKESIGFDNHARMAFTLDPEALSGKKYKQNNLEKVGGTLTWCITKLPFKILPAFYNPKILTVAFTALALLTVQFTFYPITSFLAAKAICLYAIRHIPLYVVKVSIYAFAQINVIGFGATALGRFSNDELMRNWYHKGCVATQEIDIIDGSNVPTLLTE